MNKIEEKNTPLMSQYYKIKNKYNDAILLFRVGDFYETFNSDAVKCSKILDILLTKRSNGNKKFINLAGFPHHVLDTYLPKILNAGFKVAICEQIGNIKNGKNIIDRKVTELITPGVNLNDQILDKKSNNFIASFYYEKTKIGISFLDFSTGDFFVTEGEFQYINQILKRFRPVEIIYNKNHKKYLESIFKFENNYYIHLIDDWIFNYQISYEKLINHFKTNSLKGFGIDDMKLAIIASSAILHYISDICYDNIYHISNIKKIQKSNYVWIDDFTIKNLEIFNTKSENGISLINVIDKTLSPMGARLLKHWINFPLKNIYYIKKRHDIINEFLLYKNILKNIIYELNKISDIERLIAKISTKRINPKELIMLALSIKYIANIKNELEKSNSKIFILLAKNIQCCKFLYKKITKILISNPPNQIIKGNFIREGVSKKLDNFRNLLNSNKDFLEKLCSYEKKITGINKIKISFNNILGYYFEIRNIYISKIPNYWICKQTLVNTQRYTTEKLKNYEEKILSAEIDIINLESKILNDLINYISKYIKLIQLNAKCISYIDVLQSFTVISQQNNYTRPEVNDSYSILIEEGRHPVIEKQFISNMKYISNNIKMDQYTEQIMLITGPNMSGKSAFLRQTALIIILAQIGSYVPAKLAKIGFIDKIFTRVGSSDNISLGESTFMVEMNETANILNNISKRSLIILDEIGRGTSTYDGIAIAYSIIEYIHNHVKAPKTLFATHYHEINKISNHLKRIKKYKILVKKIESNIIFMYKLIPGISDNSFGIHVAKLAGIPKEIVKRSEYILNNIKNILYDDSLYNKPLYNNEKKDHIKIIYLKKIFNNIIINDLTPIKSLLYINNIKKILEK